MFIMTDDDVWCLSVCLSDIFAVGGTVITVTGSNFVDSPNLRCKVGTVAHAGTFVSVTKVRCTTPANPAGALAVEISNNVNDYTTDAVLFTYQGAFRTQRVLRLFSTHVSRRRHCPRLVPAIGRPHVRCH
jgi:hypothetical protein